MRIVFPNGKSVDYEVPIVKVQDISCEKIIKKNLYFLFPYYILRYEHLKTDDEFQKMIKEYDTLHLAMSEAYSNGFLSDYDMSNISEYAKEIIAYMAIAHGDWDARIDDRVYAWATTICPYDEESVNGAHIYYCDDIHPANFDMIAKYIMRSE